MLPPFDTNNNLLIVDQFTSKFIRKPSVGEIVILSNPFKPSATLVKRITASEGEMAEFWSHREGKNLRVYVPPGHIWIEGDNKSQSRDSRDFGPVSLRMVEGIVRYRVWPLD